MRGTVIIIGLAASFVLAPVAVLAMEAAPDATPLLLDRVRAFDAVVIASLADGFEKTVTPMPMSNTVYLPITIEKVLKGDVKPGAYSLNVHGDLPKLLAARDKNTKHRYLLVFRFGKDYGYLAGGNLYNDLGRFYLESPGHEVGLAKLATTFLNLKDTKPQTLMTALDVLYGSELPPYVGAQRHMMDVQTRVAQQATQEEWKALDAKVIQSALVMANGAIAKGVTVPHAAAFIAAVAARTDNPEGLKILDPKTAAPTRKWLADVIDKTEKDKSVDWSQAGGIPPVLNLLAKLKDKQSQDVLTKMLKCQLLTNYRRQTIAAVNEIFGLDAAKILSSMPAEPVPAGPRVMPMPNQ